MAHTRTIAVVSFVAASLLLAAHGTRAEDFSGKADQVPGWRLARRHHRHHGVGDCAAAFGIARSALKSRVFADVDQANDVLAAIEVF